MNALDVMTQRQVPARPTGNSGETGSYAKTNAKAGSDARSGAEPFSVVLSGQDRRAAATPANGNKNATDTSVTEGDQDTDATILEGTEEEGATASGHSGEMLTLFEGLMSSAAFGDDVSLGEASTGSQGADEETPGSTTDAESAMAKLAGDNSATAQVQADQPAELASPDRAATMSGAGAAVTALASPARGSAGTGKTAPSGTPQNGQVASAEAKETVRALGGAGEVAPARPGEDKAKLNGRMRDGPDRDQVNSLRQHEERPDNAPRNVEVLESRRYAGSQSMSGNALLLTRSLIDTGSAALATQTAESARSSAVPGQPQSGQMLHTLKLQLNPLSLGSVTAVLKLSGEELSVDIKVETAEAYRQLTDDNQAILKALRSQGYGVEQINIQHVAGSDRAANQTQQAGFQTGLQNTASGDTLASGNQTGSQGGQGQSTGRDGGQGHEQGSLASSDSGRADGVYL